MNIKFFNVFFVLIVGLFFLFQKTFAHANKISLEVMYQFDHNFDDCRKWPLQWSNILKNQNTYILTEAWSTKDNYTNKYGIRKVADATEEEFGYDASQVAERLKGLENKDLNIFAGFFVFEKVMNEFLKNNTPTQELQKRVQFFSKNIVEYYDQIKESEIFKNSFESKVEFDDYFENNQNVFYDIVYKNKDKLEFFKLISKYLFEKLYSNPKNGFLLSSNEEKNLRNEYIKKHSEIFDSFESYLAIEVLRTQVIEKNIVKTVQKILASNNNIPTIILTAGVMHLINIEQLLQKTILNTIIQQNLVA